MLAQQPHSPPSLLPAPTDWLHLVSYGFKAPIVLLKLMLSSLQILHTFDKVTHRAWMKGKASDDDPPERLSVMVRHLEPNPAANNRMAWLGFIVNLMMHL